MQKISRKSSFFILLLAFSIIATLFSSCNSQSDVSDASATESQITTLVPHLGKANYSGKQLKVLATHKDAEYGEAQIAPEEQNTEPVNDAVYNRNQLLETEYGFTIICEYNDGHNALVEKVRQDLDSGLIDYDVIASGSSALSTLATAGYLRDLRTLEGSNLKLDEGWWDTKINNDLSISHQLFFATGDIFVLDDEFTCVTYFNKDIIRDNNLDNPYDLVKSGDWTLDNMYEMIKKAARDDGDGDMNVTGNDVWGLVGYAFDCYKYIAGCDSPQVRKNTETDLPYLTMTEPHAIAAFEKVFDIFMDSERVAFTEDYYAWNHALAPTVTGYFHNGKALFFAARIEAVSKAAMKEAAINYGILPQPKFNKEQENYTSVVDPYHFFCFSIPRNPKIELDFTTFAIEAMAYTSKKLVTPEYYNRTLQLKRFDDQDSAEMLDIIFRNRIADLSIIFNWYDCIQYYNNMLFTDSREIASYIDARREAFETEMKTTIEAVQALLE